MIYHALRTRSRTGEVTLGIMRAYAPLSFNLNRTDNHRWVAHLRPDLREPRGWRETTIILGPADEKVSDKFMSTLEPY
jgi:hypothetical protein